MIKYKKGDIFDEDTEALVNLVNCVGVMGQGLAFQFKRVFPKNFLADSEERDRGTLRPGRMCTFETGQPRPRYVINFPTKRHWRSNSRMEDIESGLLDLCSEVKHRKIRSISIPALGCGLGGLDWRDVRPHIEDMLGRIEEVRVVVFEPCGAETRKYEV